MSAETHEGTGGKQITGSKNDPPITPGAGSHGDLDAEGATFYAPPEQSKPASGEEHRGSADRRAAQLPHAGPERRGGADRRTAHKPPTPDYGRPSSPVPKLSGKVAQIESGNVYGLKSSSELNYPQAYAPVSREMWAALTDEQRALALRLQAIAQEKVGFEKSAPKFFIEDFDPSNPNASAASIKRETAAVDLVSLAAPRLVLGGMLIGAGGMALGLSLGHMLPGGIVLAGEIVAVGVGIALAALSRA